MRVQSLNIVNFGSHKNQNNYHKNDDAKNQSKVATYPNSASAKIAAAIKTAALVGSIVVIPATTAGLQSCSEDDNSIDSTIVVKTPIDEFQNDFLNVCKNLGITVLSKSGKPTHITTLEYDMPDLFGHYKLTYNEKESKAMNADVYDEIDTFTNKDQPLYYRVAFGKGTDGLFHEKFYYPEDELSPIGNNPVKEDPGCEEKFQEKDGALHIIMLHPEACNDDTGVIYTKGTSMNKLNLSGLSGEAPETDGIINIVATAD